MPASNAEQGGNYEKEKEKKKKADENKIQQKGNLPGKSLSRDEKPETLWTNLLQITG